MSRQGTAHRPDFETVTQAIKDKTNKPGAFFYHNTGSIFLNWKRFYSKISPHIVLKFNGKITDCSLCFSA